MAIQQHIKKGNKNAQNPNLEKIEENLQIS